MSQSPRKNSFPPPRTPSPVNLPLSTSPRKPSYLQSLSTSPRRGSMPVGVAAPAPTPISASGYSSAPSLLSLVSGSSSPVLGPQNSTVIIGTPPLTPGLLRVFNETVAPSVEEARKCEDNFVSTKAAQSGLDNVTSALNKHIQCLQGDFVCSVYFSLFFLSCSSKRGCVSNGNLQTYGRGKCTRRTC